MTSLPYNKRPYDVFVSYSHADGALVEPLVRWLRDMAGLRVWWDSTGLVAGDRLSTALPAGISSSRSALFCVSRNWQASTWCEEEYNAALQERRADRRYRMIALRLDDCQVPTFLANARYLEMQKLEVNAVATLLEALVPEPAPWSHGERDLYISRSWHADETEAADNVCKALVRNLGYRLIGDSPDYATFEGENRVRCIIESCGALVAVLPFRDDSENGFTSKWIVREVQLAHQLGRPYLLFIADRVKVDPALVASAIGKRSFPLPSSVDDGDLTKALTLLDDEYSPSPQIAYAFFATSLRGKESETDRAVAVVEQVTSMQCLLGRRLQGQHAQEEIIERIRKAQFVLADITANHLNSLIEAGMARGAGTRLHLICSPPESGELRTRFMFRDLEVNWYGDSVERIGVIHRIARLYRRRVHNQTITLSATDW
jgi:hypothetical protein